MTIITEEVGELAKAMLEHEWGNVLPCEVTKEAIQVATLCLKVAEMYEAISSHGIRAENTL
jgi:NTP pyrophosphatase (non-canonical NTP hydrolase)